MTVLAALAAGAASRPATAALIWPRTLRRESCSSWDLRGAVRHVAFRAFRAGVVVLDSRSVCAISGATDWPRGTEGIPRNCSSRYYPSEDHWRAPGPGHGSFRRQGSCARALPASHTRPDGTPRMPSCQRKPGSASPVLPAPRRDTSRTPRTTAGSGSSGRSNRPPQSRPPAGRCGTLEAAY